MLLSEIQKNSKTPRLLILNRLKKYILARLSTYNKPYDKLLYIKFKEIFVFRRATRIVSLHSVKLKKEISATFKACLFLTYTWT